MANRYWVGGSGTWDSTSTTHWALSSGGASGASAPTSSDDVFFDTNSGGGTVSQTGATAGNCNNFDSSGFTGSFNGAWFGFWANISGNITLGCNGLTANLAGTNQSITSNGHTMNSIKSNNNVTFSLNDDLVCTSRLQLDNGVFTTNNHNVNTPLYIAISSSGPTLNLGSSTITTSNYSVSGNYTLNAGTSTLIVSGGVLDGKTGKTFYNVTLAGGVIPVYGANTFNILTINPGVTVQFSSSRVQTITSLVANGTPGRNVVLASSSPGASYTLNFGVSGTVSASYINISDSTATGSNAPFDATDNGTDGGNNSGWLFSAQVYDGPKTYDYKIYRNGSYLGMLQNVVSEFALPMDINNGSSPLLIEVQQSIDNSLDTLDPILDETSSAVLDENNEQILGEEAAIAGDYTSGSLIANDNEIIVYEKSAENPNGRVAFEGWIYDHTEDYGGSDNIEITAISKGVDMQDYLVLGSPYTTDQSQTTQNNYLTMFPNTAKGNATVAGQTFIIGSGITRLGAISLMLAGTGILQVTIYSSLADRNASNNPLGRVTLNVDSALAADTQIAFLNEIFVSQGQTLVWEAYVISGSINIYYKDSDVYANGAGYRVQTYAGWSPSNDYNFDSSNLLGGDYYFKTYYYTGETTAIFNTQDPSTMLQTALDNYISQGGSVNYSDSSIQLTEVSVPYTFITNTVLDAAQKWKDMAPADFYWFVDPGTLELTAKQTSTTSDHLFILGRHISNLKLKSSIENTANTVVFSGGDTGSGSNLLSIYTDLNSIVAHGRQRLYKKSDGRVTVQDTADQIGNSYLDENSGEEYQTTLIIPASVYDISTIKPGHVAGFAGFNNRIDYLLVQIARVVYHPDYAELTLGRIPPRTSSALAQLESGLETLETINNPSTPS